MEQVFSVLAPQGLDRTLLVLGLAALLGGLVRGFTGFGFAMIFMPLAGLAVPLPLASALIWALDAPFALPLAARSLRKASWREVLPLLAGAAMALPLGLWLLLTLPSLVMRWLIAGLILAAVLALATGWRWRGRPGLTLSFGVGGLSGLGSGLAQLGGMPLAIFWLSAQNKSAAQMRHDLVTYFACATLVSGALLAWSGVLTSSALLKAVPLLVPYGLGILIGTRCYRFASESTFRRIAYGVIALAALISLPLWDGWLGRG
ncbi:MAG: TSUP family transporter [Beijerinckiaceae bacterium]|jgi:hypothetical protein|nr:TSUP family transporter [Beijerinckiaceae bacterium]